MGSTSSTAHPYFFCRALHLTPSDNKFGRGVKDALPVRVGVEWVARSRWVGWVEWVGAIII